MTDLSELGRARLRQNAEVFGDRVLIDVLDALEAVIAERDLLVRRAAGRRQISHVKRPHR